MRKKSDKEKLTKEIRVVVQPTLYYSFEKSCEKQFKTISEVIRNFMLEYSKENNENS